MSTTDQASSNNDVFRVYGTVRDHYARPLPGTTVRAYDRDLRNLERLGSSETDKEGAYVIEYTRKQFAKAEKKFADLVLVVGNSEEPDFTSEIHFNAPAKLLLDVNLDGETYRGPSDWEMLTGTLTPLLDGLDPRDLREDDQFQDVSFLSGESARSELAIGTWLTCFHLAAWAEERKLDLPPAFLYAYLRQGQPALFYNDLLADLKHPERVPVLLEKIMRQLTELEEPRQRSLLEQAVEANLVPAVLREKAELYYRTLAELRIRFAGEATHGAGKGTLRELFSVTGLPERAQTPVLAALLDHSGSQSELWKKLEEEGTLEPEQVSAVRSTFELAGLTRNHIPLVAYLHKTQVPKRKLAQLDKREWVELFRKEGTDGQPIGIPANIDGETEEERFTEFGAILEKQFQRAYPTAALSARIAAHGIEPITQQEAVVQFLENNPGFHLDRYRIDHYLHENPAALEGIREEKTTVAQLKAVQRVFKLNTNYAAVNAMLTNGLQSAQQIYFLGREQFTTKMKAGGITSLEAKRTYQRAEGAYATVLALYGEFNRPLAGIRPYGLPGDLLAPDAEALIKTLPNLSALFGSLDYCSCRHCRSVYGPAAHFVDVLRFLEERDANGTVATNLGGNLGRSVREALFARRPDLGDVELSCQNTNTPLPYIDLVNEILEDIVATPPVPTIPGALAASLGAGPVAVSVRDAIRAVGLDVDDTATAYDPDSRGEWIVRDELRSYRLRSAGGVLQVRLTRQTHLSAEELRATPEYINPAAYDRLEQAVFPLGLPYNLAQRRGRAYLAGMGLPEPEFLERFQNDQRRIASSQLNLSTRERAIITGSLGGLDPWEFWGLQENGNNLPHPRTPTDPTTNVTGPWQTVLRDVPMLLHRSGLSYQELLQLLDTEFVNPGSDARINDGADTNAAACDVSTYRMMGLSADLLDRFHRFLRLWRKLSLPVYVVDDLIRDGGGTLDDAVLDEIAAKQEVRKRLGLTWPETRALYVDIPARTHRDHSKDGAPPVPALYEQLFRNRLVDTPTVFPPLPADLTGSLDTWVPGLLAVLRVKEDDLTQVLTHLGLGDPDILNHARLSELYRITSVARALRLSVAEYLILDGLFDGDPFADPGSTLQFVSYVRMVQAGPFSPTELDYLLRHQQLDTVGMSERDQTSFLTALRTGLLQSQSDLTLGAEQSAEDYVTARIGLLATVTEDAEVNEALSVINNTQVDTAGLDRDGLIDKYFTGVLDLADAKVQLAAAGLAGAERFAYVQPLLQQHLIGVAKQELIVQFVMAELGLEAATASLLLDLLRVAGSPLPVRDHLAAPALTEVDEEGFVTEVEPANFPEAYDSVALLHKLALVLNGFALTDAELEWWSVDAQADAVGWPRLTAFSLSPAPASAPKLLRDWLYFHTWKVGLSPDSDVLLDYLQGAVDAGATFAETATALAELTAIDEAELTALAGSYGWGTVADLLSGQHLLQLDAAVDALDRLGVQAERAIAWAGAEIDDSTAEAMRQTFKAKYDIPTWQAVIRPLEDRLREEKRDALVAYLTAGANARWLDASALYGYFLIDVEMSACMLTSRLRQATAAAQLFVQRCQLNIEADLTIRSEKIDAADTIADGKWKQWQWMKYYRVWEANRKVFLYPENWIEPELRDDKSPYFLELEEALLKDEVRQDTVEIAYREYLDKLDKVANLEICATHREYIPGGGDVWHVFGRTRGSLAPETYYRKRINGGRWTAWENTNLEVTGKQLLVGMHNKRLFLFWPQMLEKATEPTVSVIPGSAPGTPVDVAPIRYWEMRLFWSEYKGGNWSPKILSDTYTRVYHAQTGGNKAENIALRVHPMPFPQIEVFATDRTTRAPDSRRDRFQKIGPAVAVQTSYTSHFEHLIAAPESRYYYGLLKHTNPRAYFYFNRINDSDKIHYRDTTENALTMLLLQNIEAGRSFTLLDSVSEGWSNEGSFFFFDTARSYSVDYRRYQIGQSTSRGLVIHVRKDFSYAVHYHPFVELFTKELNIWGIPGLLNRRIQVDPTSVAGAPVTFDFTDYQPTSLVKKTYQLADKTMSYPVEDVDFSFGGAYAGYNWELFFHVPFLIANRLSSNQRFAEALEWYHYIFNPTSTDATLSDPETPQQQYWVTKPFYETTKADYYAQKIENLLLAIAQGDAGLRAQVEEWRDNPFNPHLIARMRTVAYQKSVLIKYVKTLIAWGDYLFRSNTMETIDEASQLYVLARTILGPRPVQIPKATPNPVKTYYQLQADGIGDFGNATWEIENLIGGGSPTTTLGVEGPELPRLNVLYFCIPNNDKLLELWDTVDDRLFKIRHCMNIEGVVQELSLFGTAIDPGALVSAMAGGGGIGGVLAGLSAPLPNYRFTYMINRALELTGTVQQLGGALLSALEKRDAEAFATLRNLHESMLHDAEREARVQAIEEAKGNLAVINATALTSQERITYYEGLIDEGWTIGEQLAFTLNTGSTVIDAAVAFGYILSGGLKLVPDFLAGAAGFGGSPTVNATMGGSTIGNSAEMAVKTLASIASTMVKTAGLISTASDFGRRAHGWEHQKRLAEAELPRIERELEVAGVVQRIAEANLSSHDVRRENLTKELEYLQTKFTNEQLYAWMTDQLSGLYFQAYKLAYDVAQRAERCFRYEMGLTTSNYLSFGYWDSRRKGLLAGEKLLHDLHRLEAAYREGNRREYELTKHVALSNLDPVALLRLRTEGDCFVDIPEVWFDMDFPGHYHRRLKSVRLSLPAITGPYTTIACTLTMTANSLRTSGTVGGGDYARDLAGPDPRFRDELAAIQSIATSSGRQDAGLFEFSFRDERYLPFEGAGAISSWRIRLNGEIPQFDLSSITDAVIHLDYTAREGGDALRTAAVANLRDHFSEVAAAEAKHGLFRVYDIRREFATAWHQFLHPGVAGADQVLTLPDLAARLPYFTRAFPTKEVSRIELVARGAEGMAYEALVSSLGTEPGDEVALAADGTFGGLQHHLTDLAGAEVPLDTWTIRIRENGAGDYQSLPIDTLTDLFLIVQYAIS